jgi:quercetin dioxygenase-like cupin family protein
MPAKPLTDLNSSLTVENPEGIIRTTLSYIDEVMMCHFKMAKGAEIPLHNHPAAQIGYLISGRVRFVQKDDHSFIAEPGTSYAFGPHEFHGAVVLEDSEAVETFAPMRPEYVTD